MIKYIFYLCFVILCAAWAFFYYILGANGFVHIILGMAAVCVMLNKNERKHAAEAG